MSSSAEHRASNVSSQHDDGELLVRLRSGETQAYAELVERHGPRLLAVIRRIIVQRDDAEDALQDAFVSAFKSLATFQGDSQLGTWLHRIAVNAALMKRRAAHRRGEVHVDPELPKFTEFGHWERTPRAWSESAAEPTLRAELRDVVRSAIERLPENHRIALVLRDIEELDNSEVAHRLGITVNAAKIRVHRARQALRELLDVHFSPEDA